MVKLCCVFYHNKNREIMSLELVVVLNLVPSKYSRPNISNRWQGPNLWTPRSQQLPYSEEETQGASQSQALAAAWGPSGSSGGPVCNLDTPETTGAHWSSNFLGIFTYTFESLSPNSHHSQGKKREGRFAATPGARPAYPPTSHHPGKGQQMCKGQSPPDLPPRMLCKGKDKPESSVSARS